MTLWQLALLVQDDSYVDGICAALNASELPPEARAMRLFRWVSASPDASRTAAPARTALTFRSIVEHRAFFRTDCGTNARLLCELARRAGLEARELRLCDAGHTARHVVCEIRLNDAWAVFDPTSGLDFRRADGRLATAAELRSPALLAANAARVPNYDLRHWRFDHAERLHFEKLPVLGRWLRRAAAWLTGRPSEELALPAAFHQPHLVTTGSLGGLSLLSLVLAGGPIRRRRAMVSGHSDALPVATDAS
jgi:hypothetical protein